MSHSEAVCRFRVGWLGTVMLLMQASAVATTSNIDAALDVYARPQQLVTLPDGRHLNMLCLGHGTPVVLLEVGAGGSTLDWRRVHLRIAQTTRACAYDRAGMGFSDPGPLPRTAEVVTADLALLLKAASIAPPYVLVAHSLGSYYVRLYADHHLRQVAGMVLVDPSVEYQDDRFAKVIPDYRQTLHKDDAAAGECLRLAQAGALTPALPVFKECTYGYKRDPAFSDLLYEVQIRRRLSAGYWVSMVSESAQINGADSAQLVAARRSYGSMPLIVLTQAQSDDAFPDLTPQQSREMDQLWQRMHDELAALSSRGVNRRVEHTGHYIQKDRPEVVVDAVSEVVSAVRTASGHPESISARQHH